MTGKRYPRTVAELVDQDYVHRLPPADRAWLDQFNDEFYNAAFTETAIHPDSDRRDLYRTKDARNRDIYGRGARTGGVELAAADENEGELPLGVECYLATPGYKAALNEFRRNLPQDDKKIARITPDFMTSKAKLEAVTHAKSLIRGVRTLAVEPATYERMIKTRLEKMEHTHRVIMNIGGVLVRHQFTGQECEAVVEMFNVLDGIRAKLEEKIKRLGGTVPTVGEGEKNG